MGNSRTSALRVDEAVHDQGAARIPSRGDRLLLVVLLGLVGLCVWMAHGRALSARALSFDDQQYLTENYLVQHPSWGSAKRFLTEVWAPSTVGGYYQPLAMISLMLDYAMAGDVENLRPFHRTSLVLHVLNTLLIVVLLYLLFGNVWAACLTGLLFGVHPLTVEPIPWVGERKTVLAAFFALWSLIFYVRYAKTGGGSWYVGCVGAYVLALLSKPTSTPLPAVMLLLDFWPLGRFRWRSVWEKLPLLGIGAVSAVVTFVSQKATSGAALPTEYPASRVPLVVCHNIVFYLYKMVWPVNLSSHYPFPEPVSLSNGMMLAGVVGTAVLISALVWSLRWTRAWATGWLMFFVAIVPTMQIIGFSNVIASDKFAYLPSVGVLVVVAWVLGRWLPRGWGGWSVPAVAVLGCVGLAAALEVRATRRYLAVWRDTETLYEHMIRLAPAAPTLRNGLGAAMLAEGKVDKAVEYCRQAVEMLPDYADAQGNLGAALARQGDLPAAVEHCRIAVRLKPRAADAHSNLGAALGQMGDLDGAVRHCTEALRLNRDKPQAHYNLGQVLAAKGDLDGALRCYGEAIRLKPSYFEAHANRGYVLAGQGRVAEAIDHLVEAVRLRPSDPDSHYNLASLLDDAGRLDEAFSHYRSALQLRPGWPEAHTNLGNLFLRRGQDDRAIQQYQEALAGNAAYLPARLNLGQALLRAGRTDEAIGQFREAARLSPADSSAWYLLGVALERKDSLDEAIQAYRRAIEIAPQHVQAAERLKAALARRAPNPSP